MSQLSQAVTLVEWWRQLVAELMIPEQFRKFANPIVEVNGESAHIVSEYLQVIIDHLIDHMHEY